MNIKKVPLFLSIILIFSFLISPVKIQASENEILKQEQKEKSVVFLLDTSGSMKSNDPNRLAIDSIAQLIYSLPSNYTTGFVAYNNEVSAFQRPIEASQRNNLMKIADTVQYQGYTNAGAGLEKAVELLKEDTAQEKIIVILSDGEILRETEELTKNSIIQFEQALEEAKLEKIRIHVVGLGEEMEDTSNQIFSAASETKGMQYYVPFAIDIQEAIDDILTNQLKIKHTTAAILEADGTTEELTIQLPEYVSQARILLTSNAAIQNLKTDFHAETAKQYNGERYSLIELTRPSNSEVSLSFQGQAGNQIRVEVITEYQIIPKAIITYTDTLPADSNASAYERMAHIQISFQDANNENISVLMDSLFDYKQIPLLISDTKGEYALSNGQLLLDYKVLKKETLPIKFDYSNLPTNILSGDFIEIDLEAAPLLPPPEPEPDYTPIYLSIALGVFIFIAGIVAFYIIYKKHKNSIPIPAPEETPPPPSKYSYTGKLNLYITKTKYDYDIPPLSFNLFRIPSNRVLSLNDILKDCNIEEILEGANKIFFKSGANQSLIITNNSDCTIMKNREILMKGRSYTLPLNAKLDITFEDEYSEMMLQYKDAKI